MASREPHEERMKGISAPISSAIGLGAMLLGFVSVLVAIVVVGLAAYWNLMSLVKRGDRAARTHLMAARIHLTIDHLEALHSLLDEVEMRERDYLISGDQNNLELYRTASAKLGQEVHALEALTRDEPGQQQRLTNLEPLIRTRLSALDDSIQVRSQMGSDPALEMSRSSSRRSLMDDILRRLDDMIDEERLLLPQSKPEKELSAKPAIHFIAAGCIAGLVLLSLTALYIFRGLRALRSGLLDLSRNDVALQTQGRFMDAVLDGMDEGVVLLDRDLKVVRSNPVAEQLLKTSKAQVLDELRAELEPSSAGDRLTIALDHFQNTLPDIRDHETTDLSISSPGKPTVTSIAATGRTLRDETGALQGGVLLFRDVTKHKSIESQREANEASLISLFHYGLEAALVATLDDSIYIGVNEGFLRLCGYSRDEILGRPIEELNVLGSPSELGYALDQVRTGQILRDRAVCFCTKSGHTFDAALSVMPIEFGGLACVLFILSGIKWRVRPSRPFRGLLDPASHETSRRPDLTLKT
jgi:PAS domain S-box-containing protein